MSTPFRKGEVHVAVQYWVAAAVVVAVSSLPARVELRPQPPLTPTS